MSFRGGGGGGGDKSERGFFRSFVSSIGSSSGSLRGASSSTSSNSPNQESGSLSKHHSFSGNMSFNRMSEDNVNGNDERERAWLSSGGSVACLLC